MPHVTAGSAHVVGVVAMAIPHVGGHSHHGVRGHAHVRRGDSPEVSGHHVRGRHHVARVVVVSRVLVVVRVVRVVLVVRHSLWWRRIL